MLTVAKGEAGAVFDAGAALAKGEAEEKEEKPLKALAGFACAKADGVEEPAAVAKGEGAVTRLAGAADSLD